MNRHGLLGPADFKSTTSTDFVTRAVLGRVGILNQLPPHCQFINSLVRRLGLLCSLMIFLTSCAKYSVTPITVQAKPSWFKVPERFQARTDYGEIPLHAFFDLVPFASVSDLEVNFVALTPIGSAFRYELDLVSGKHYMQTPYCSQRDSWKGYGGVINLANFTEGFIPRVLDKKGTPQEVIVFGERRYLGAPEDYPQSSQRVRIIGGLVEQECEQGTCKGNVGWSDRIILVGVNPLDPNFKDVTNLLGLKKQVDWEYTKAFLGNRKGQNRNAAEFLPAYRIISEMSASVAFKEALAEGHYFKYEELDSLRLNCMKLYDHVWNELLRVESDLNNQIRAMSRETLKVRTRVGTTERKDIFSNNVISAEKEDLAAAQEVALSNSRLSFDKMWRTTLKENGERLLTCNRWVRPADLKDSPRRHWTFAYLNAFLKAQKLGYFYDCGRRAWLQNPMRINGKRTYEPNEMMRGCSSSDFDEAFDRATTLLTGIYRSGAPSVRYIGYDSGVGGSAQRLHAWVADSGKRLSCVASKYYDGVSVFPEDLSWKELGWIKSWSRDDLIR